MVEPRRKLGKAPQGVVRLNAHHQGNQVVVEVSDDGRGIDVQKIRAKAIELGLTTREEAARLNENETLDFIFRPGFSTAVLGGAAAVRDPAECGGRNLADG